MKSSKRSELKKSDTEEVKESFIAKEKPTNAVPSVSYFELFRFATTKDKIFIILATISSIISGITVPLNTMLFSSLLQSMVDYGRSVMGGQPEDEIFLRAVRNFALRNSLLGITLIFFSYTATVLMNISAYNQVYKMRQEYLKAVLNQDFEYFDKHQTGDVATKMTADITKLQDGIGEKLATYIYYQTSFVSAITMAVFRGWKLALICLVSFPVTLYLVRLTGSIASSLAKKEAVFSGKAGSVAEEVLSSVRTVYAFSGQKKEVERYESCLEKARSVNIQKSVYSGLAIGFLYFFMMFSDAMSFWFGYQLVVNDPENYSVDTMMAVFFGVLMGTANFGFTSSFMVVFGSARGAAAHIFNLINNVPTINPLQNRGAIPKFIDGNIELRNVFFQYPSRPDVPVLKGVSLSVNRGQSVALVGPSGCGKSTIIQLISRYYDTIEGEVIIDGHNVRELSVRWLRAQIGLVGQEPVLFNTSVRENIRYGREDASDQDIEAAARQANAHHFIMKMPSGYDTLVGERGTSLSGGQKQRIAIARALVRNPSILLLDEATSALDNDAEAKVQAALDKAQEGRTTIVVAHRLSTIRHVDKIYVFKSGQVVEVGNHDQLMKKKGHYYDMVVMQSSPVITDSDRISNQAAVRKLANSDNDEDDCIETRVKPDEEEPDPEVSFWQVMKLSQPEWRSITAASVCSMVSGFAMPIFGATIGGFVGVFVNPDSEEALRDVKTFSLILVGVGLFSGLTNFVVVSMYGAAGEYLTERLKRQMFGKFLQQEVGFFDDNKNSTGALCARLSGEAAMVQGATGQRIGTVLQAVGTFSISLGLSLYYEWRLGLVAFSFVPIITAILFKEAKIARAESLSTAKAMEASSKIAVESVANVRTVASLGREAGACQQYAAELLPAHQLAVQLAHWRGLAFGLARGVFYLVYAGTMYHGGHLIVHSGVHYDDILKSAQSLLMGSSAAAQALAFAPNFQRGISAAGRIIALLNRQAKITDPEKPEVENFRGSGEARLRNIKFKYPTRPLVNVFEDFNLEIEKGKTIALVGASGCGKSTVIQLLERFYDPDEGIVAQYGIPLPKLRLADVRHTVGLVQQEPILFDRTIRENIAYGDNSKEPSMDEIVDAAKQANIHSFIESLPMGYDTNIGSKGTQLSGGQKQRIAIARALVRRPKMLLLDEATSALDSESEKEVQEALDAAKAGRTCVVIAHRLSTVRDADLICVLSAGRVAERGSHQHLMDLKGLYYNLHRRNANDD